MLSAKFLPGVFGGTLTARPEDKQEVSMAAQCPIDHRKLRRLASAKELSGRRIAESLGVTPQAAGGWLRGTSQPMVSRLVPLAELLGTTVDELFVGAGDR